MQHDRYGSPLPIFRPQGRIARWVGTVAFALALLAPVVVMLMVLVSIEISDHWSM